MKEYSLLAKQWKSLNLDSANYTSALSLFDHDSEIKLPLRVELKRGTYWELIYYTSVRSDQVVRGMLINETEHKINLFADNIGLILADPIDVIPKLQEETWQNFVKFEAIPEWKISFSEYELYSWLEQKP